MKINSCFAFAFLLLLVSYALAVEASQHETMSQKAKAVRDKVEPADHGGGSWNGGGCHGPGCGGGGGHNCYHGCCNHGYHGCNECCHSAEEAKAFAEKQAQP
ncbi:glycine-rich protein 3 short isoform-like [Helianthus annuus]|uniref:glycine-rich protein 3 short isoform-like n=1 Tax=Helianthus annuus TaxID=4232 RepID=UPI000B8F7459|nr:glycine-rich protein 3 short isoform-like [Helianthus annuus]